MAIVFLTLTAIAATLTISSFLAVRSATNHLSNYTLQQSRLSAQFEANVFRVLAEANAFVRTGDPVFRDEIIETLDRALQNVEALNDLRPTNYNVDNRVLVERNESRARQQEIFIDLEFHSKALIVAVEQDDQIAITEHRRELQQVEDDIENLSLQLNAWITEEIDTSTAQVSALIQRGIYGAVLSFGSFLVLIVFMLWMLRKYIVRPIGDLTFAASAIASGNLDHRVRVTSENEVGKLQRIFNQMVGDLQKQQQAYAYWVQAEKARSEAEQANKAKSAFLASMSHELRTPLTSIIGFSELLQLESQRRGHEMAVPDLENIRMAGRHLLALVDNVLDFSKIEADKMELHLESFSVSEIVDEVVTTIRPMIERNHNTIEVHHMHTSATMCADSTKVRQILFNVLGNAAKFTHDGLITCRFEDIVEDEQNYFRFTITDTGIGMSPEQVRRLFRDFAQVDSEITLKYGGTGLGLALSQRLCVLMGGSITVASNLEQGTTFTILLPSVIAYDPVTSEKVPISSNGSESTSFDKP
ncbi:MAG: ATP-binding protein [Chloroflexota bacterium]